MEILNLIAQHSLILKYGCFLFHSLYNWVYSSGVERPAVVRNVAGSNPAAQILFFISSRFGPLPTNAEIKLATNVRCIYYFLQFYLRW